MARSNKARTEATRNALLDAARKLFVAKGFAETATPEIAAAANVTRGALYHHFPDKKALFTAVAQREGAAVAAEIEQCSSYALTPRDALIEGAAAYLDAMAVPGRTKLLLLEAPALVDEDQAEITLNKGLFDLLKNSKDAHLVDPLTILLSAAFDRAALEVERGGSRQKLQEGLIVLIDRLDHQ
jgi:AcrR family transcriptional regulator